MARQMCVECPFRPGSPKFRRRDGWIEFLKGRIHGCHMVRDHPEPNPGEECVGSVDAANGILHEPTKCSDLPMDRLIDAFANHYEQELKKLGKL